METTNIVQFGMYKGLPAEILPDRDPDYCAWLLAHQWFRDSYPKMTSYFVRRGIEPMRRCTAVLASGVDVGQRCPKPAKVDTYCRMHYRNEERKLFKQLEEDMRISG